MAASSASRGSRVQRALWRQRPQNHAVRPQAAEQADRLLHLLHLYRGVKEIPKSGADEDVDGHAAVPADLPEQGGGGRRAADG